MLYDLPRSIVLAHWKVPDNRASVYEGFFHQGNHYVEMLLRIMNKSVSPSITIHLFEALLILAESSLVCCTITLLTDRALAIDARLLVSHMINICLHHAMALKSIGKSCFLSISFYMWQWCYAPILYRSKYWQPISQLLSVCQVWSHIDSVWAHQRCSGLWIDNALVIKATWIVIDFNYLLLKSFTLSSLFLFPPDLSNHWTVTALLIANE